ncbi:MAG: hydantoinase B/oxoprolinase family protein [Firmicutes bacterium]|nr:hydantoinase B/oxoprolinase family protein [Bacillota bacterium]
MNQVSSDRVSPVLVEVVANRLMEIILEAAQTIQRVSGELLTVASADFAIDLFDADGNAFVYSPVGLPRQGSAVRLALPATIQQLGEDPGIFPEDVIITNDPYTCTLHIVDLLMIKPVFFEGRLLLWVGVGIHKVDMGGITPGLAIMARNAYQEGLLIPPIKIIERGKLRKEIVNLYMANVRARRTQELDLRGQIAAVQTLDRRLQELIARVGVEQFQDIARFLQDTSERVVRSRLEAIPDGTYEFTDYLDHDGLTDRIYTMKCRLTVDGNKATVDFTGTDPQSPGAINCTLANTHGAVHAGLLTLLAPDLAPNEGVFNPVEMVIPEGTLLKPVHPAPTAGGATEAGYRAQCIFLGAVTKACAASDNEELRRMAVSAEWGGSTVRPHIHGTSHSGHNFTSILFDSIGMGGGARCNKDGMGVSCIHTTVGAQFQNVELLERDYPILYLKRGFLDDSPGAGRHRGGPSLEACVAVYDTDRLELVLPHNRRFPPSWGVFGGGPGAAAWVRTKSNTDVFELMAEKVPSYMEIHGQETVRPQKSVFDLMKGDVLCFNPPGGGGYGDPLEREPDRVKDDVLDGLISADTATRLYGVVMDPAGKGVDPEATRQNRATIRAGRLQKTGAYSSPSRKS